MKDLQNLTQPFQDWVVAEMSACAVEDRTALRGDYLFFIDGNPAFVFAVDVDRVRSVSWDSAEFRLVYDAENKEALLRGAYRTKIETDSVTLGMILTGTLKARIAFVTGRITIAGDLPGFMRLTSLLKARGIRPLVVTDTLRPV